VELLSFQFNVKSMTDSGVVEGLASTYGNVDRGGDVVERGAFTKSLAETGGRVPLLWQHQQHEPIGSAHLTDSALGLLLRAELDLEVEMGRRAYSALKKRICGGLSIGYDLPKSTRGSDGTRRLLEIKLWEVSVVTIPMNPSAVVTRVKHADGDAFDSFRRLQGEMTDSLAVLQFRRLLEGRV
jgi:HK97 family phage prohead protease